MLTLKACSSGWTPASDAYNGLANSRFHTLLFGINSLRSDELPHCWANSHCSEAFVQLLCNQDSNGLSCRCRPITSANDGASRGFAIIRSARPEMANPVNTRAFIVTCVVKLPTSGLLDQNARKLCGRSRRIAIGQHQSTVHPITL